MLPRQILEEGSVREHSRDLRTPEFALLMG
jgi:hypothetical protein